MSANIELVAVSEVSSPFGNLTTLRHEVNWEVRIAITKDHFAKSHCFDRFFDVNDYNDHIIGGDVVLDWDEGYQKFKWSLTFGKCDSKKELLVLE